MHYFMRLIGPLFVALLLLPLGFAPPAGPAVAAVSQPEAAPTPQATMTESETNDTLATANRIITAGGTWTTEISGAIGSSTDIDYFFFDLTQPASRLQITLDNLPADYDLILAASPAATFEQGSSGIDDIGGSISAIGGSISAIGGSISAIGGSISAIGGSISAIGGSISAIGGSISAISANAGSSSETIDTFLWQPGTYYVAVGAANGEYSASPYRLTVQATGSNLGQAPPPPTVEMRVNLGAITYPLQDITTLYVVSPNRMKAAYSGQTAQVDAIITELNRLASGLSQHGTTEYGYVLNLDFLQPITRPADPTLGELYQSWLNNQGNPFYANRLARTIDNLIKAASDRSRAGGTSCPDPAKLPPGAPACPAPSMFYAGGAGSANSDAPFPNVRYIVLVGGDNLMPFFRTPDLTTIANEADYAAYLKSLNSAGIINPDNPQGAALRYRMTLSDNPYGADKPLRFQGFPLFIPNRAVGRLVESPTDILRYLGRWGNYGNYTIDLQSHGEGTPRAYVNGYDFLKDQAGEISKTLNTGLSGSIPAEISGPIDDIWTRSGLESSWFGDDLTYIDPFSNQGIFSDSVLNDPYSGHLNGLFSLNSHFDHWQLLPARETAGNFLAERIFKPNYYDDPFSSYPPGGYFSHSLGFSVGCHSGYNVLDDGITFSVGDPRRSLYGADFAQAFIRQAGNWIGNTGYGYGTADGIDYSERLALYLTRELLRDVRAPDPQVPGIFAYTGASIGPALVQAKQRYMRNVAGLSAYDAKALTVMTLYGLPFINVLVDNPLPPPPEERRFDSGGAPLDAPGQANAPFAANSNGLLERVISVTITLPPADTISRTGSKHIIVDEQHFSVQDSFVQAGFATPRVRPVQNNQVGLPHLPAFAYDISALNKDGSERLQVRDIVFVRGEYAAPVNFDPQITQVVSETEDPIVSTADEPNFAAGAGIWYPDKFFAFSSVGQGEEQRDQLIATAAQFKADENGITGQLRGYKQMVFKVYYIDPNAAPAAIADDETPPTIQSVQIDQFTTAGTQGLAQTGNSVRVVAIVDKGDGTALAGVSGVYVQNGTTWTPVVFTKASTDGTLERWEAWIDLPPGEVRAIISATDAAGNVSYYTAKGTFNLGGSQVYLPLVRR